MKRLHNLSVVLLLLMMGSYGVLCAQINNESALRVGMPSPTSASLGKYGDIPVSLYTGLANIDIPLYEVTQGPLSVPVSLNYHASGIKPDDIPGWVGSGWSLFSGGVITRVVSGLPDDFSGIYLTGGGSGDPSPITGKGYAMPNQGNNFDACISGYPEVQDKSCEQVAYHTWSHYKQGKIDMQPDQFNFNFNGSSGKFYFGQDGLVHSVPFQPIRIIPTFAGQGITPPQSDLEGVAWGDDHIIKWEIILEDGTSYTFEALEINTQQFGSRVIAGATDALHGSFYSIDSTDPAYVSSWYLTKITSPNKDHEIRFEYDRKGLQKQYFRSQAKGEYKASSSTGCSSSYQVLKNTINVSKTYTIYLKSIKTYTVTSSGAIESNTRVEFSHSKRNDLKQTDSYKLDEIQILYGSTLRKRFGFLYRDVADKRLRLEKVQERPADPNALVKNYPAPYEFYYDPLELPPYHSNKTDHWGYFNDATNTSDENFENNPPNTILLPSLVIPANQTPWGFAGPLTINSANREPDEEKMKAGTLKTIVYPTGGFTTFEYQAHRYDNNSTPKTIGGLRIWRITSSGNDIASGPVTKEYDYTFIGDDDVEKSSGIYAGIYPKYFWTINSIDEVHEAYFGTLMIESGIVYPLLYTQGSHISYSEVTEKRSDGSKTKNVYYSFFDYPDQMAMQYPNWVVNGQPFRHNMGPVISWDFKRGFLKRIEYYKAGVSSPLKTIEYKYKEDPRVSYDVKAYWSKTEFGNYTTNCTGGLVFSTAYSILSRWYYKSEEITTYSDGVSPIVTAVKYLYDVDNKNHYQLSKTVLSDSRGQELVTYVKYPQDYSLAAPYDEMISRNMINAVVERISLRNNYVVGAQKNEYALEALKVNPKRTWITEINSNVLLSTFNDSYYKEIASYEYDESGNVTTVKDNYDQVRSYKYSYNKSLPVIEIRNATPAQVFYTSFEEEGTDDAEAKSGRKSNLNGNYTVPFSPPADGKSYWLTYSTWQSDKWIFRKVPFNANITDGEKLDEIRVYPEGAQLQTYTYDPLVGVTSTTDFNGKTRYFEYDGIQRLVREKDDNKHIVKNYEYNHIRSSSADYPIWIPTGNTTCIITASGPTGYQDQEQRNGNPLSTSYGQTRWINVHNTSACPTCYETSKKWINNRCEQGTKVYGERYVINGRCFQDYWYAFSDGTYTPKLRESSAPPCQL